jgi:cyclase
MKATLAIGLAIFLNVAAHAQSTIPPPSEKTSAQSPAPRPPGIDYDKVSIRTTQLAPNVYALTGSPGIDPGHPEAAGGRIGVLAGPEGIFLVDAQYMPLTGKVVAAIRQISPAPIRFLVNTHSHPDHTGGNPNFVRMGALLFAREEVYRTLLQPLPAAVGNAASSTDPARLPVVTFGMGDPLKIRINGEIVDLIPVRAAHTDGDALVRFEKADVIMIGDFYRNYGYPFVDPGRGGSFAGVLAALDTLLQLAGPDTQLVPGHGSIIHRSDIPAYRDMILSVRASVQRLIDEGKSKQEILNARLTAPYDANVPGGLTPLPAGLGTSADRFVSELYAELATAKKTQP